MNDKKRIEELASLMADCSTTCDECFEKFERVMTLPIQKRKNYCQVYAYAQKAVEQGYRKIPKDSVVLSKEECEKLTEEINFWHKINETALILTKEECDHKVILDEDHYERLLNNVRKDTAKEFAEQVKMAFYAKFDELIPSIMADKIDELLKEYEE